MAVILWGMIILVGVMSIMAIGLSISTVKSMGWITGIMFLILGIALALFDYMMILKAISEKIIGG